MIQQNKLAILVGGGPAPGINSVISAATIRANLEGVEVLGVQDGFKWLMEGNVDHIRPLDIDDVSQIHFRGGSCIGISRANPTKDPKHLENTVVSLLRPHKGSDEIHHVTEHLLTLLRPYDYETAATVAPSDLERTFGKANGVGQQYIINTLKTAADPANGR